jgi:hypothetical protein
MAIIIFVTNRILSVVMILNEMYHFFQTPEVPDFKGDFDITFVIVIRTFWRSYDLIAYVLCET